MDKLHGTNKIDSGTITFSFLCFKSARFALQTEKCSYSSDWQQPFLLSGDKD
jgi:hypothetical protein